MLLFLRDSGLGGQAQRAHPILFLPSELLTENNSRPSSGWGGRAQRALTRNLPTRSPGPPHPDRWRSECFLVLASPSASTPGDMVRRPQPYTHSYAAAELNRNAARIRATEAQNSRAQGRSRTSGQTPCHQSVLLRPATGRRGLPPADRRDHRELPGEECLERATTARPRSRPRAAGATGVATFFFPRINLR